MAQDVIPVPMGDLSPVAARPRIPANLGAIKQALNQPAVKKSMPLIIAVVMLGLAAIAWSTFHTPPQRMLYQGLGDADKAAIAESLTQAGIKNTVDNQTGTLTVSEDDYYKARMLLASQNLPKAAPGGYAILDQLPMGVSRAVEGERLRQARESELAKSVQEIDSVIEARVHLAVPENTVFLRDSAQPSASVVVRLAAGRTLSEAQVRSIINLVASSVPGMKPDAVTVVDQAGELLTIKKDGGTDEAGQARLDFQRRMEAKYREQLAQLLTPLVGMDNFTAEVQAEVNLDETQATRESYDKDGTALRTESGSWTGNEASPASAPGGIPGAMSNTPPPPATATPGNPQPTATSTTNPTAPPVVKQTDQFARQFEVGKEISVTRATPGNVKRLSVAVVLRQKEGAKKLTAAELQQITNLVRSAVGYDQARQDQVTVIERPFAGATDAEEPAWYDASWLPMVARNGTAVLIALLVLLLVSVRWYPPISSRGPRRRKPTRPCSPHWPRPRARLRRLTIRPPNDPRWPADRPWPISRPNLRSASRCCNRRRATTTRSRSSASSPVKIRPARRSRFAR